MVVLRNERPNFPTKLEIDHFTDISNLFRGGGGEKEENYMERGVIFTKSGFQKWDLSERGA